MEPNTACQNMQTHTHIQLPYCEIKYQHRESDRASQGTTDLLSENKRGKKGRTGEKDGD